MKDPITELSNRAWRTGLVLAAVLLSWPWAAAASEVRTTVLPGEAASLDELPVEVSELSPAPEGDQVNLTLEDAIALTLRRNLSLVVERYRRSQAIQGIEEAFGIFDLNTSLFTQLAEDTRPITSTLEEAEENTITNENVIANLELTQLTAFGGTASLAFDNTRFASSNLAVQPNPQFTINFDLAFTQPLLRNFGRDVTRNGILVARNNSKISREAFQAQVEAVVQQVSDRYWLLVEALEQLKVAEESLSLAKDLHNMNRIQVEVGTLAPLEMVRSEAGVATREEEIIRRQAAVADSADVLRQLLNLNAVRYWDVEIVPVTEPITDYVAIELDDAYATALEKRTDVQSQLLTNANRDLAAQLARNQRKPQLDLVGGYGLNGVDGDLDFVDFETQQRVMARGGYSDALEQILDAESEGWYIQAVFSYPLQNRAAKARSAQADLDVEQGAVELKDLEQQVLLTVRQLARAVKTAEQQIESAKVSTKLQRENLEAERKRYENGLSTSFEVLQIQEDLTEALSREVTAITNYRRALNAFYAATGEILEKVGVELADDEAG